MKYAALVLCALTLAAVLPTGCASGPRAQLVMETDLPPGVCVTPELMPAVRGVLERRLQALQVRGAQIQMQDEGCAGRIVVDWPAGKNAEAVARSLQRTGLLELVEIGPSADPRYPDVQPGAYVRTTSNPRTPDAAALGQTLFPYPDTVFKAVLTGRNVKTARVELDSYGQPAISFQLDDEGTQGFADYTTTHVGDILAIVMDNVVLSAPRIQSAIPEGKGMITGKFTREEADSLTAQMSSGALPAPLRVLEMKNTAPAD
jgi:preprotein translocase subunit SecD